MQPFLVTVDVVAFAPGGQVLLVRRGRPPYAGSWALPGGFVETDEDLPDAAVRELAEETGLELAVADVTQLGAYGAPGRDPRRGRVVTIAFTTRLAILPDVFGADDAAEARWMPVEQALAEGLAFDHARILADALAAPASGAARSTRES
ncbi:NUDIX domain-containing protein [Nocardioides daejeonensis]|uniref:NUDIX domain-containing protein n=1 Tax=Nocardioides daejeonensis TaxID=1046556 RepID=UPI001EF4F444|nr:NUDIX hydrolase [Nocardioides daejeonensis]